MAMNFLEFEQPIAELEAKIEELRFLGNDASAEAISSSNSGSNASDSAEREPPRRCPPSTASCESVNSPVSCSSGRR